MILAGHRSSPNSKFTHPHIMFERKTPGVQYMRTFYVKTWSEDIKCQGAINM